LGPVFHPDSDHGDTVTAAAVEIAPQIAEVGEINGLAQEKAVAISLTSA
jgi:hypothetical protein